MNTRVSEGALASPLVGRSVVMEAVREQIEALAAVPWHGRIEGPRGSGKARAAELVHARSSRAGRPYIRQSMSAMVRGLEMGRLFGWNRGAFTGAFRDTPGVMEEAHGGTLFLDEIAWARRRVRGALLQLLEDRAVLRAGEHRPRRVDVRFLFGTNVDLEVAAAAGRFPEDLLDRMGVLVVRMPALRDHLEDVPDLVAYLVTVFGSELGRPAPRAVGETDMDRLTAYHWPGNVRELENAVKHWLAFGQWPAFLTGVEVAERERIECALRRSKGNKRKASRMLGTSPTTLYRRIEQMSESMA